MYEYVYSFSHMGFENVDECLKLRTKHVTRYFCSLFDYVFYALNNLHLYLQRVK